MLPMGVPPHLSVDAGDKKAWDGDAGWLSEVLDNGEQMVLLVGKKVAAVLGYVLLDG